MVDLAAGPPHTNGKPRKFPSHFKFGAASSATQVEGGCPHTDWADFARIDGRIPGNASPLTACDSWNRFREDVELQRSMNLNAYRLSIEWARVEPEPGKFDLKAIEHYRQMLGTLVDAGIDPMVTLHHFSIPIWARDAGGFLSPEFPEHLAAFARKVVPAFGDLVRLWITINEPNGLAALSHLIGFFPPQVKNVVSAIRVHHNLLKSHVLMYRAIHEEAEKMGKEAQVGVAHHVRRIEPLDRASAADRAIARLLCATFNDSFADALCTGSMYGLGDRITRLIDGFKVANAKGAQDFFGLNYYGRDDVHFRWHPWFFRRYIAPGAEVSDLDWPVCPEDLLAVLREWWGRAKLPIYITENGLADEKDVQRASFIVRHLAVVAQALSEGIDLQGYYHWSLMDNFEWMFGYQSRFGLAHVDFKTFERTLRPSGRVYGEIVAQGEIPAELWERYKAPPPEARRMGTRGASWP
jgi:beta-glucosidase